MLDVLVEAVEQEEPYPSRHDDDAELDAVCEVVSIGAVSLADDEMLDVMS